MLCPKLPFLAMAIIHSMLELSEKGTERNGWECFPGKIDLTKHPMWRFPGRGDMIRSPHPNSTRDVDFAPSVAVPLAFAPDDAQIPPTVSSPAPEQVDFGHPSIDPAVPAAARAISWNANPPPLLAWSTAQVMSPSGPDAGQTHFKNEDKKAAQPRQIRFVSNDGQPHAKRRRINAA
jgi:hypothetical protein